MKKYIDTKKKNLTLQDKKKSYAKRFLKEAEISARLGKTIYIRQDHQKMQAIVQTIGHGKVSLFSFLDNVIADHLERHRVEIGELYNEYCNPLSDI